MTVTPKLFPAALEALSYLQRNRNGLLLLSPLSSIPRHSQVRCNYILMDQWSLSIQPYSQQRNCTMPFRCPCQPIFLWIWSFDVNIVRFCKFLRFDIGAPDCSRHCTALALHSVQRLFIPFRGLPGRGGCLIQSWQFVSLSASAIQMAQRQQELKVDHDCLLLHSILDLLLSFI